jgi:hypothetical protein
MSKVSEYGHVTEDEFKDALKERDARIAELTRERDSERELVAEMREQVESADALIESWIEAFDMTPNDAGQWSWHPFVRACDEWREKYLALLKDWNRFVPQYNAEVAPARRNFGRPLAASDSQRAEVLKLREAGLALRAICDQTALSLRTVRTIIDKRDGVDRATMARLARIAPDKLAEAKERMRRRSRDALPGRIAATLSGGKKLLKATKGLR